MSSKRKEAEEYYLTYVSGLMNETEKEVLQQKLNHDPAFAKEWHFLVTESEELQLENVLTSLDIEEKLHASKKDRKAISDRKIVRSIMWLVSTAAVVVIALQFYMHFVSQPSRHGNDPNIAMKTDKVGDEVIFQSGEGTEWTIGENQDVQKKADFKPMDLSSLIDKLNLPKSHKKYYTVQTPVVKDYKLQLEDGTLIWLNMSTAVRFPATFQGSKVRRVYLEGEAYFDVAHLPQKPFIVVTPQGEVEVKGTTFNLSTDSREGMKTALVSGRVVVKNLNNTTVSLQAGEEAIIDAKGQLRTGFFKEYERLSWMKGTHYFYKITFAELALLLPKWYGVHVQFDENFPTEELITGVLHKGKLSSLLKNIKHSTGHTCLFKDNTIIFKK